MDYHSSGSDDDVPPSGPGRASRGGRVRRDGRATGGARYGQLTANQQMRKLEQDAYTAVLQAFKAQSEHITWDKEQLMANLRKELRISHDEHLKFIEEVGANATLRRIRERKPQFDEHMGPPPILSAAWKKQKTAHVSHATLPPPTTKATPVPFSLTPAAVGKKGTSGGSRGKKSKGARKQENVSTLAPQPLSTGVPSVGRGSAPSSRDVALAEEVPIDPWIGKRVKTRWPEDNAFYEAVIADYNPENGLHALVYEMNTEHEQWEWVDLKQLPQHDLEIVSGPAMPVTGKATGMNFTGGGQGTANRGNTKARGRTGLMSPGVMGRKTSKGANNSLEQSNLSGMPTKDWKGSAPENGSELKGLRRFQLPSLDALVKEIDKIAKEEDLMKILSVKRAAKEHEELLKKALAEIGESSTEGESDEEENPHFFHTGSMDHERERRSRQDSREQHGNEDDDDTAGDVRGAG